MIKDTNNIEDIFSEFDADLSDWNDEQTAFIKNDFHDGNKMWLIYSANGTKIAATDDRDFAFIMAKQNNLNPCSVH